MPKKKSKADKSKSLITEGQITAAEILSDPTPKKKRKKDDPKDELKEELKTIKPEEVENIDVSVSALFFPYLL